VPSLTVVRQSIPEDVEDAVMRSLEKVPADRFATAAEFANALKACDTSGAGTMRRTARRTQGRKSRPRNRSLIAVAVALGILVISGAAWAGRSFLWGAKHQTAANTGGFRPQRIAVLNFQDMSGDKHLGYLADGVTKSLTDQLSRVNALDVISSGGVNQFRGKDVARDSIARVLEAGTLVDGSVNPEGNNVRVTMRLVDGNSDAQFDEASVVAPLGDPLTLTTKLADQLSLMLRQWLRDEIRLRALRTGTQNPNAWSLVQRAERMRKDADASDQGGNTVGAVRQLLAADTLLTQAEALDPKWPEPIVLRGKIAGAQERMTKDPAEAAKWIDIGLAHADRALAIDSRDPDALELRGTLRVRPVGRGFVTDPRKVDDLIRASEQDLRAAIAVNPTQAGALNLLSRIEDMKHDPVESHNLAQRAYEADAFLTAAPDILWRLYVTSYDLEQFTNAEKWCDVANQRFPQHFVSARCRIWIMTAKSVRPDAAEAWRRAAVYANAAPAPQREYYRREGQIVVADVLGRAGLADSARRVLVRARADRTIDPRGELMGLEAFVRTQMGDKKEAVDLLQRYLTDHPEHRAGFGKISPWWWRDLQNDPRFKTLITGQG
jgi:TolB-like protein/tetratricopeptide (TPR) repeat protein